MLVFYATERLCRKAPPPTARLPEGPSLPAPRTAEALSGEVIVSPPLPAGTRYQIFRALREMANGESMVVEHRIPSLDEHFGNPARRESWFRSLIPVASWQDPAEVEPVIVPGTAFPRLVGRILLRNGWSAATETPHWVPNLRFFNLTERGRAAFGEAQSWWQRLSPGERLRMMIAE